MINYCLDTNAISDIMREREDVIKQMNIALDEGSNLFICSIAYYEIVRGFKIINAATKLKRFYKFYNDFPHLYLDRDSMEVIEKSTDIYNQLHRGQQIEDNDIYIAAIAMANDCTLVTANDKHFGRIKNLKYVNWRG